jgi:hypothetical protein
VLTPAGLAAILLGMEVREMENETLVKENEYLKELLFRVLKSVDSCSITDDNLLEELNNILGENGW